MALFCFLKCIASQCNGRKNFLLLSSFWRRDRLMLPPIGQGPNALITSECIASTVPLGTAWPMLGPTTSVQWCHRLTGESVLADVIPTHWLNTQQCWYLPSYRTILGVHLVGTKQRWATQYCEHRENHSSNNSLVCLVWHLVLWGQQITRKAACKPLSKHQKQPWLQPHVLCVS